MTFGMTMRYHYEDARLAHGGKRIATHDSAMVDRFWQPDLFVQNGLDVDFHDAPHPNAMIRIDERGAVTVSKRYIYIYRQELYYCVHRI
jgi:hypothetical protein